MCQGQCDAKKTTELVRFWRQFGLLLSSGVPILEALKVLRAEIEMAELQGVIDSIHDAIKAGKNMHGALAKFPDFFAPSVIALCHSGEGAGCLDVIAERIAKGLESGALATTTPPGAPVETSEPDDKAADEEDVIQRVTNIIVNAYQSRASDIHVEPTAAGGHVRLRIDGVLQAPQPLEKEVYDSVISRLKIMANVDLAEKRRPTDGRIKMRIKGRDLDLRCSFACFLVEGRRDYSVVMRLLDRQAVLLDVDRIGASPETLAELKKWPQQPNGIYIVTGPTGSGKTTLLYALLQLANTPERKVLSAENPVEYLIPGVMQAEVQDGLGVTFPNLIRSFLRQDPDVILVGEIRDFETAIVEVQAALTGHLVFSTLHTNNATSVPRRLVDIGIEPWLVLDALRGVAAMRLIRKVCQNCKEPYTSEILDVLSGLSDEAALRQATFVKGKGCDQCHGVGYRGRMGIFEIMPDAPELPPLIARNVSPAELREAAVAAGMVTMRHDGLRKAAQGLTTIEEVVRVTQGTE